jgi:hypothetical protein
VILPKRKSKSDPSGITLDPNGTASVHGARANSTEAKLLHNLLESLASLLPVSVTLPISDNGPGMRLLSQGQRMLVSRALGEKRYLSEEELKKFEHAMDTEHLASACSSRHSTSSQNGESTAGTTGECNLRVLPESGELTSPETTFIHDVLATCDVCSSPLHPILQGEIVSDEIVSDQISQNPLQPIFYQSKLPHSLGFLIPSLGVHQNDTQGEAPHRSTGWQSKTRNKLLWRGGPAVDVSSNALDKTRRTKLAAIAGASEGERDVLVDRGGEWKKEAWGVKRLNERYMDVDFADSNSQV